jgi:acyl carrier protein
LAQGALASEQAWRDGWDSLSNTVFLLELEREFAVPFDVSRVANIANACEVPLKIARLMS